MQKIVHVSCLLKWCAIGVAIALPIIEAGYWITCGYPFLASCFQFQALPSFGAHPITWDSLDALQRFLGFAINLIPLMFSVFSLYCLARLFAAFENMALFERENVKILNRAGKALVYGQLIHPIYTIFLSLALTFRNPIGERNISITLGSHQFEILVIGLSILLASWVFQEAVFLQEEQETTI
jgi:hypothetical protein